MIELVEPIKIPIEDSLDLHTFKPSETASLLEEYFNECLKKEIFSVKVIHGKGKGVLRKTVLSFLDKSPVVKSYKKGDFYNSGNWGAVIVELKNIL
jgi:DNA-nicking Smr family endonuclease